MEKKKLVVKPVDNHVFLYQNNPIEIRPYLTAVEQAILIEEYVSNYFYPNTGMVSGVDCDYLGAEYYLMLDIINRLTSVLVDDKEDVKGLSLEELVTTTLWVEIKSHISNYKEFREMLDRVVSDKKEQIALTKSVGATIDRVVEKVEEALLNLAQNVDPEKLKEVATGLLKDMEKSPMAPVFAEAQQEKVEKVRRTRKKKAEKSE
jgi:hypothetical protein